MNGLINRVFYTTKPLIPRRVQIAMRRRIASYKRRKYARVWPIDPNAATPPPGWQGWPDGKQFALVLSHDVDTADGYRNVLKLAELEEKMGFRSQFNFVPERYGEISLDLLNELRRRGFGVGVHGLKHDGKLFLSKGIFDRSVPRINSYLSEWKTEGFSSPSMHRNLDWMTALNIKYSISTFDTDPFEPQPDGIGTIFPFVVSKRNDQQLGREYWNNGMMEDWRSQHQAPRTNSLDCCSQRQEPSTENLASCSQNLYPVECSKQPYSTGVEPGTLNPEPKFFIELPYTLPQDSTLFIILREKTIDIWKCKLDWISENGGMALVNTHPDYMDFDGNGPNGLSYPVQHYIDLLEYIQSRYPGQYFHALPGALAEVWSPSALDDLSGLRFQEPGT